MYNYTVSTIIGFVAMACAMSSYFLKNKSLFLFAQGGAILFLALSCLFIEEYYAMISYTIGILRIITYYIFERKNKSTPFIVVVAFVLLFLISYFVTNVIILKTFKPLDIILMCANIIFTFAFSMRNLILMRYVFAIPLVLCIIYYISINATLFVIISYSFELCANVTAMICNSKWYNEFKEGNKKKNF